jgi:hypothetical protein
MKKRISYTDRNKAAKKKGFKNYKEYLDHFAKEKGFENYKEYTDYRIRQKGFVSRSDYENHLSQQRGFGSQHEEYISKKGFKNDTEYRNYLFRKKTGHDHINTDIRLNNWAHNRGFSDYKEYLDIITIGRGLSGIPNIICDDRSDMHFIGHLAEYGVSRIFKNIQGMFFTNRGYDFVCETGEKIEVKASLLHIDNKFTFHIKYNDIADYFIFIGFDNVLDLNPLYMWMIKNREIIRDVPINDNKILSIANDKKDIAYFQKYEKEDKLEELKNICTKYNIESGMSNNIITKTYIVEKSLEMKISDLNSVDIFSIIKNKQRSRKFNIRMPILPAEECNR